MVAFPGCKINLGLHILSMRPDGYHAIQTCFYPLPWTDVLEILPASKNAFHLTGLPVPGRIEDNLCTKAYQLLQRDFQLSPIQLHLHKVIPTGAGLGGGSADAAHTLRLLNSLFDLHISTMRLMGYAAGLGSDCAFFIQDKAAIGSGRGDVLEPASVNLHGYYLLAIKPHQHVPTAEAYAAVTPRSHGADIRSAVERPVEEWGNQLVNDFEVSVFNKYPDLMGMKEKFNSLGAIYSSLSGSGSSLYGIFDKEISRKEHFPGMAGWSGWL